MLLFIFMYCYFVQTNFKVGDLYNVWSWSRNFNTSLLTVTQLLSYLLFYQLSHYYPCAMLCGNSLTARTPVLILFPLHEPSIPLSNFQLLSFDFLVSYPSSPASFKVIKLSQCKIFQYSTKSEQNPFFRYRLLF